MNDRIHILMDEITKLTARIEANYPAIYKNLQETPLPSKEKTEEMELEKYRDTLRALLKNAENNSHEFDLMIG